MIDITKNIIKIKHSIIRLRFPLIVFSIIIILSQSCTKTPLPNNVFYIVTNNADSKIKVFCKILITHTGVHLTDSVFRIESGKKKTLIVRIGCNNPENYDTLQRIQEILIYKNDTILSNKNFNLTKYWNYSIENDYKAVLNLPVNTGDF